MLLYLHLLNRPWGEGFVQFFFSSFFLFNFFSTESPPEAGTKAPLTVSHTLGAAFRKVFPLDNEPHPKYSGLCAPKLQSLNPLSLCHTRKKNIYIKKNIKSELLAEGVAVHAREKKKEKKKYLAAPAVSETSPLPSYNKQEKQDQNTAPTSPSIHTAQAALVPATAQKQSRCKPPLAHPSRWPEQQKSPAQEAWIQCMGSLKCLPGSAKVLHAPRQRKGYPQVPLPAPTLGDSCVSL